MGLLRLGLRLQAHAAAEGQARGGALEHGCDEHGQERRGPPDTSPARLSGPPAARTSSPPMWPLGSAIADARSLSLLRWGGLF